MLPALKPSSSHTQPIVFARPTRQARIQLDLTCARAPSRTLSAMGESPKETTQHRSACTECQRRKQKVRFTSHVPLDLRPSATSAVVVTLPPCPAIHSLEYSFAFQIYPSPSQLPLCCNGVLARPSHLTFRTSAIENGRAITARSAKSPTNVALVKAKQV